MAIKAPWGKVDQVIKIWLKPFVQWKLWITEAQINKASEFYGNDGSKNLPSDSLQKETKKAAKSKNKNENKSKQNKAKRTC